MTSKLTLYGRRYCHLCDDMLAELVALRDELGGGSAFLIEVVDVDTDPELVAQYDELVPVLVADGRELCHYFLDAAKVREYLSALR